MTWSRDQNLLSVYLERFSAKNTQDAYRRDLEDFFAHLGTTRLRQQEVEAIDTESVNAWIRDIESSYKPRTLARKISAIRGFFEWLLASGTITRNPAHAKLIRKSKASRSSDAPVITLSAPQASALIKGASSQRDSALISILLYCVLRRSEASNMDIEDILESGGVPILKLPTAKGGTDQYVKIPRPAYDRLMAPVENQVKPHGAVWRSTSNRNAGERLSARSIYNIVRETSMRAGLSPAHSHLLRHTGCTLAIDAGASVVQVKDHARHQSLNTTMTYVHQRDKLNKSAGDFIDLD